MLRLGTWRDWSEQVKRETTVEEVNGLLKAASEDGPLKDILGFETRPLVSTDYVNDERSSIVDAASTMVIDGTMVKVHAASSSFALASHTGYGVQQTAFHRSGSSTTPPSIDDLIGNAFP